jgi:hypothetical protein
MLLVLHNALLLGLRRGLDVNRPSHSGQVMYSSGTMVGLEK